MKREAVNENVRFAALEKKKTFFSGSQNAKQTKPEESCLADHPDLLLARLVHQVSKRLLPGVHLDHLHPVDDLVHQSDPPVSLGGSFDP